jgi:hypothetical protein
MSVHEFLYAIHPWLTWPGFTSVLLAAAAAAAIAVAAAVRRPVIGSARWIDFAIGLGVAGVLGLAALQCVVAILYLVYPSYLDWVEPGAVAISWLNLHGYPIYPPIGSGDLYPQVYGPLLFQVTGLFLGVFGPTIAVSKIPALAAFALTQILIYAALRRGGGSRMEALTLVACQCAIQAGLTNQAFAFGVRADPWLYLMAAAATYFAVLRPTLVTAALFGAMAGLATNFKLDAALYEAPLALYVLWRDEARGRRLQLAASGLAGFAVAFALPFAGADAANYLAILKLSNNNRVIERTLAERNVLMIAFLLMPPAWLYLFHRPRLPRGLLVFFAATLVSMLVILYPASKDGAGPHHFLPYVPSLCWAFLVLYRGARSGAVPFVALASMDLSIAVLLLAIVLGYSSIDAQAWDFILRDFATTPAIEQATAEIDAVLASHPHVTTALGPGANPGFDVSYLRIIPVFKGSPLPIDPVTWTDRQAIADRGRDAAARKLIRECRVDMWLIPRGDPVETDPGTAMFADDVAREFLSTYELTETGAEFQQWRCIHNPAAKP